jgi:hypothetical protein
MTIAEERLVPTWIASIDQLCDRANARKGGNPMQLSVRTAVVMAVLGDRPPFRVINDTDSLALHRPPP